MKMGTVRRTGNHKGCPYDGLAGAYFHTNRSCRLPPAPISMKMGTVRRTGNHKGCPYDGFAGAYFHTNRSCRLSPAPISMKMGTGRRTGNHKGCPYDGFAGAYFHTNHRHPLGTVRRTGNHKGCPYRVCRGLFSYQSLMQVATCTHKYENGHRAEDGQPQGLPLRRVCRGPIFIPISSQSAIALAGLTSPMTRPLNTCRISAHPSLPGGNP